MSLWVRAVFENGVTRACGELGIVINLHGRFCLVPSFLSRFQFLYLISSPPLSIAPFHSHLPHPHPCAKYSQALSPSGGGVLTATHTSSSILPAHRSSRFQPDNLRTDISLLYALIWLRCLRQTFIITIPGPHTLERIQE